MTPQTSARSTPALGIELPGWPKLEAPIRCFAQPDAHQPRRPLAVLLGQPGLRRLELPRMRRPRRRLRRRASPWAYAARRDGSPDRQRPRRLAGTRSPCVYKDAGHPRRAKALPSRSSRPQLTVGDADVQSWAETLDADRRLIRRLILERAWAPRTMRALQVGFDGARITIPIRNAHGHLRGMLRYDAFGRRNPKMRAVAGTRLGLIPHPARDASDHIVLVEGPPDMIAARSAGLPAIAIPGTHAWHPAWAQLLAGRRITIVMDCDAPGRRAAARDRGEPG